MSTHSVFGSSLVIRGNYSQLNPIGCGISRLTPQMDTDCFEWYKQTSVPILGGTPVSRLDVPWMAHIVYKYMTRNNRFF